MIKHKELVINRRLYLVSNIGTIDEITVEDGITYRNPVNPTVRSDTRRCIFKVSKNGVQKQVAVHRLVAEAFMEDFDPNKRVYHKDGNPEENDISNLTQDISEVIR